MPIRRKLIRQVVDGLLRQHGIAQPPVNIKRIAENLGARVAIAPAPEDLSGFLMRPRGGSTAVIGVNAQHSPRRQRFTIAHEIAHLVLHAGDQLHVDRSGLSLYRRNPRSAAGVDDQEMEANLFAAEVLMPDGLIRQDVSRFTQLDLADESSLQDLATRYQVSVQAMTFRLSYLGYLRL